MKIYNPEPDKVIRLQIIKQGFQTEYITLWQCTVDETADWIRELFRKDIDPFATGRVVSVVIREGIGSENGTSKSVSFKGFTPKEVYDRILKKLS